MVQFGKQLQSQRTQEWDEYYIDYASLKWLIKKAKRRQRKAIREEETDGALQELEKTKKKDVKDTTEKTAGEEGQPLLGNPSSDTANKTTKKRHKKNQSSLGNILDLMQSSSTDNMSFNHQSPFHQDSSTDSIMITTSTTDDEQDFDPPQPLLLLPFQNHHNHHNHHSRSFQHMADDGYLGALEFRQVLDQEIETLVLFSLKEEGRLSGILLQQSKQRLQLREQVYQVIWNSSKPSALQVDLEGPSSEAQLQECFALLQTLTASYRDFAAQLLQLLDFMDINVTALRKILKKHDKNFPHFKLTATYLQEHLKMDNNEDITMVASSQPSSARAYLQQIYHFGGLSSLIYSLASAFDELHSMEWNLLGVQHYQQSRQQQYRRSKTTTPTSYGSTTLQSPPKPHKKTPKLDNRKDYFGSSLPPPPPPPTSSMQQPSLSPPPGLPRPPPRHHSRGASLASPLRSLFKRSPSSQKMWSSPLTLMSAKKGSTTTITLPHEPILDQIYAARNRLKETTQYAQNLAAQALVLEESRVDETLKTPASEFTAAQRISSLLNLASCFLYMTNYYVVAPTVGNYAELLGSSESMSGIIIGMTPNAALLATILYGWWSNHSYRNALLFAACSSVLGNVLYAMALHYDSLTMVLLGRFFNGFGSARSINRRYIADTFSKADRTAASADFVTSGALGMAAGPAIAFLLGHVAFPLGNTVWSSVTSPGWIMMCLWSIFLLLALVFFQEPDRSHLFDSVKEKDEAVATDITPTKTLGERIEVSETTALVGEGLKHGVPSFDNSEITGSSVGLEGDDDTKKKEEQPLWKNAAVMNSLWLYFVLKLVLEMLLSSTPTVTKFYFGWQSKKSGLFMMFMALLMFPANIVVARLSQRYEDRELIFWALVLMLVSVVGILDYTAYYPVMQYVVFAVGIFISTNSLEGPNMGLLSKTIPKSWAKGTFNSGFLATEAGTLARSVGDVLISGIAGSFGMSMLLNGLFLPMSVLVAASLLLVLHYYPQLTDANDEDDDDDTASIASVSMDSTGNNRN